MALNNMSDGVGKKIVEALKMQDEAINEDLLIDNSSDDWGEADSFDSPEDSFSNSYTSSIPSANVVDAAFQQSVANNLGTSAVASFSDDFEYPANVAVLKQLITKLPAGVSRQTGALIIKQTMEALGISMSSVLQEARQVQENLANSSQECKNNIAEYKKQITVLEAKSQQYQRQHAVMSDIINLFLQTGSR